MVGLERNRPGARRGDHDALDRHRSRAGRPGAADGEGSPEAERPPAELEAFAAPPASDRSRDLPVEAAGLHR